MAVGLTLQAWFYGDAGKSNQGGAGHDARFGSDGNDLLLGGGGRDLMIGGAGSDRLVGNARDDFLIAASTIYNYRPEGILQLEHKASISAILRERLSTKFVAVLHFGLIGEPSLADRSDAAEFHPPRQCTHRRPAEHSAARWWKGRWKHAIAASLISLVGQVAASQFGPFY